jgi:hypothetical protein
MSGLSRRSVAHDVAWALAGAAIAAVVVIVVFLASVFSLIAVTGD